MFHIFSAETRRWRLRVFKTLVATWQLHILHIKGIMAWINTIQNFQSILKLVKKQLFLRDRLSHQRSIFSAGIIRDKPDLSQLIIATIPASFCSVATVWFLSFTPLLRLDSTIIGIRLLDFTSPKPLGQSNLIYRQIEVCTDAHEDHDVSVIRTNILLNGLTSNCWQE